MTDSIIGKDQQLVYRIDCNKHYTVAGAPPILVLQKDSFKPPIIILEGTQTQPSKTPIIRDERRDQSQGYILQDERKPPSDNAQLNPASLPHLSSSHGGENLYPYHRPMPTPVTDQHMYYSQEYPTNQSQDPSSFGKYPSDLSYNNNNVTSSPWMYGGQYQHRQPYNTRNYDEGPYSAFPLESNTGPTNSMYDGGYTRSEPYHWQSALYQHDPWMTSQPIPTQHQAYVSSPFFNNNNMTYDDRLYGRENLGMSMMPKTPSQPHYDPSYDYNHSTPWTAYNNNDNSGMMPMQENITPYSAWNCSERPIPPLRRNPTLPTDERQPAFRVVNGPRRSKSVTFAPLPDHPAN